MKATRHYDSYQRYLRRYLKPTPRLPKRGGAGYRFFSFLLIFVCLTQWAISSWIPWLGQGQNPASSTMRQNQAAQSGLEGEIKDALQQVTDTLFPQPSRTSSVASPAAGLEAGQLDPRTVRILVVDDEAAIRNMNHRFVKIALDSSPIDPDTQLETAADREGGLQWAEKNRGFSLVLFTDLNLQEGRGEGFELIAAVKAADSDSRTILIATPKEDQEATVANLLQTGQIDQFISKPHIVQPLQQAIKEHLLDRLATTAGLEAVGESLFKAEVLQRLGQRPLEGVRRAVFFGVGGQEMGSIDLPWDERASDHVSDWLNQIVSSSQVRKVLLGTEGDFLALKPDRPYPDVSWVAHPSWRIYEAGLEANGLMMVRKAHRLLLEASRSEPGSLAHFDPPVDHVYKIDTVGPELLMKLLNDMKGARGMVRLVARDRDFYVHHPTTAGLETVRSVASHPGPVESIAVSFDSTNRYFATVGGGEVRFLNWDGAQHYESLKVLPGLRRFAIKAEPRQGVLISLEAAETWDVAHGGRMLRRGRQAPKVTHFPLRWDSSLKVARRSSAIAVSPWRWSMAIANEVTGSVIIHNLNERRKIGPKPSDPPVYVMQELKPKEGKPLSVAYRSEPNPQRFKDGSVLLIGTDVGTVEIWALTGRKWRRLRVFEERHTGEVVSVAFPPVRLKKAEEDVLASADDRGEVRIWIRETGSFHRIRHPFEYESIDALAFTPDGQTLASAGTAGSIHFWDVGTGQEKLPSIPGNVGILSLAFSPDGRKLVIGRVDNKALLVDVPKPLVSQAGLEQGIPIALNEAIKALTQQVNHVVPQGPQATESQVFAWFVRQPLADLGTGRKAEVFKWLQAHGATQAYGMDPALPQKLVRRNPNLLRQKLQDPWPFNDDQLRVVLSSYVLGADVPHVGRYKRFWSRNLGSDYAKIAQELERTLRPDGLAVPNLMWVGNSRLKNRLQGAGLHVKEAPGGFWFVTKKPLNGVLRQIANEITAATSLTAAGLEQGSKMKRDDIIENILANAQLGRIDQVYYPDGSSIFVLRGDDVRNRNEVTKAVDHATVHGEALYLRNGKIIHLNRPTTAGLEAAKNLQREDVHILIATKDDLLGRQIRAEVVKALGDSGIDPNRQILTVRSQALAVDWVRRAQPQLIFTTWGLIGDGAKSEGFGSKVLREASRSAPDAVTILVDTPLLDAEGQSRRIATFQELPYQFDPRVKDEDKLHLTIEPDPRFIDAGDLSGPVREAVKKHILDRLIPHLAAGLEGGQTQAGEPTERGFTFDELVTRLVARVIEAPGPNNMPQRLHAGIVPIQAVSPVLTQETVDSSAVIPTKEVLLERAGEGPLLDEATELGRGVTLSAGLETAKEAGVVILSFDIAAHPALQKAGLETLTVAVTPTDAQHSIALGIPAEKLIGILWAGLEEKDYLAVDSGIRHLITTDPLAAGWRRDVASVISGRLGPGYRVITVYDADSLMASLEELGMPGVTIAQVLEARAGAEETLEQMK